MSVGIKKHASRTQGEAMEEEKKEKSRASQIIDGDIEPQNGRERAYLNLRKRIPINTRPPEEQLEIRRKGQKAQREIYGKKKSAKESLDNILSIKVNEEIMSKADLDPSIIERVKRSGEELTFYDLLHMVAIGRAIDGSVNAMTYVRDTYGDKPTDKIQMTADIMTDTDRELLQSISDRLQAAERIAIVEDQTEN